MQPMPKNRAQEFLKTLSIKNVVSIRDVLLNQVLNVTSLRIFKLQKRVDSNSSYYDSTTIKGLNTWLFFNN